MKQISFSFVCALLCAISTLATAQTIDLSELSDEDIAKGLIRKTIEYSSVPLSRNHGVYKLFRWYCYPRNPITYNKTIPSSSFYNSKYFFHEWNFYSRYPNTILLNFLYNQPDFVEVEENGDIHTWPVAAQNIERDGSFVLYTDKMEYQNAFAYYRNIYGRNYYTVQTKMNMMKINQQHKPILDVLNGVDFRNAVVINPRQIVPIGQTGTLLFSYSVTYSEKPQNVFYTPPTYIALAGQVFMVNDGVHYDVPLHDIGYLSLIEGETMTCQKTISFEDIANPTLFCHTGFDGAQKIYCTESSFYLTPQANPAYNEWRVFSQNGSPIYILSDDFRNIDYKIIPGDGDVIFDMVETPDYFIYCGTNKKHGYVGFDNPNLVIVDKQTCKEVARYNSSLGSERKGKLFCRVLLLRAKNNEIDIYLEMLGDKQYSDYSQSYTEYGLHGYYGHGCITEVVRLSSLINKK